MTVKSWFEVNKKGLEQIQARKGKAMLIYELYQNAWDENTPRVDATLKPIEGTRRYALTVSDECPEGFKDISHAFTLFAQSDKKSDPTKRGRFNIGEKLVLACCHSAQILTTTGCVIFNEDGTRRSSKNRTEKGSVFSAELKMTKEEYKEACQEVKRLIPPKNIITTFNGKEIKGRKALRSFVTSLPTEVSDDEGNLKKTARKTTINIYRPHQGEEATIYEMGIPVVATENTFHIDVQQKVPLNMDRDNVTPKYLKTIRTFVLNHTFDVIDVEDSNTAWVQEATSDERCSEDAIKKAVELKYGKKAVIFDPSDPEANKLAVSKGYTVIPGAALSKGQWSNIKKTGAVLPAGKVTPSSKILSSTDGVPPIPRSKLTKQQTRVVLFSERLGKELIGSEIRVEVTKHNEKARAWYGGRVMTYNLSRLGNGFFSSFPNNIEEVIDLCIHEFGHELSGDHLSDAYYRALTKYGAKAVMLAVENPYFFKKV